MKKRWREGVMEGREERRKEERKEGWKKGRKGIKRNPLNMLLIRLWSHYYHMDIRIIVSSGLITKTSMGIDSKSTPNTWNSVTTLLAILIPWEPTSASSPNLAIPSLHPFRPEIPQHFPLASYSLTFPKSLSTVSAAATTLYLWFPIFLKERFIWPLVACLG